MAPRVPTAAQLSLLRQRPHRTRVWLSIYQPGTIFAARISMPAIVKGERVISIASLAGDPNSVARNMTCYIGTTPGAQDQGRMRVISATSGQITLAENAVDWVDGWYLTVLEYMEPWAVFPRIVLTNNIPAFYKDYDIAYADQNLYLDPLVCMGPNVAGFMATGAFGVYYSSSGTYDPTDGSIPTGYAWYFEGGTPTGSGLRDPGWVQYTGAGHFMTSLTVTANSGKQFTGRRFVSVYTRPDQGPAFPILKWGFTSFEGARDNGGWSVRFFVREPEDFSKVKDGALVVLFTDDWQGTVPGKLGANAENRDNILFCGYIEDKSITIDPVTNRLEFRAASVTNIASKLSTYSATLESKPGAQTWNEMTEMTIDKAVVHFLRWHSTILGVADFSPTGDVKPVQYADFSRGGLYEAVNGLVSSALLGAIVSDRQGKMWAEVDLNLMPTGSARLAAAGVGTALGRQDWRNRLDILRTWRPDVAYVELGGIAYNGPTTGTNEPYLAGSPGDVADYWGSVDRTQGLVLASQTQLNELVGLYRANRNLNFKEVTLPLAGDYRFLDIAPQARVLLSISPTDNWRGLTWVQKAFIPQQLTYQYTGDRQTLVLDARVKEEASAPPGTTIIIPVEPPYDEPGLPGWDITFPPIAPFPQFPPPIVPRPPDGNTVYLPTTDGYLYRTRNFWSTTPTWTKIVNGVAGGTGIALWWLNMNDPVNGAFMFVPGANGPLGYMTNTLDAPVPTWVPMWTDTDTTTVFGGLSSQIKMIDMHQEPGLGYFIALASQGAIGTPPGFLYGAPGGWTACRYEQQ